MLLISKVWVGRGKLTSLCHAPLPPVDDHDGQHDADEDGVKDYDEEQDVRLARSVVHDEFTQNSEKKEI